MRLPGSQAIKVKRRPMKGEEQILKDGEERRESDGIHMERKQEDILFGESGERESVREDLGGTEEFKVEAEVGKKNPNLTHV